MKNIEENKLQFEKESSKSKEKYENLSVEILYDEYKRKIDQKLSCYIIDILAIIISFSAFAIVIVLTIILKDINIFCYFVVIEIIINIIFEAFINSTFSEKEKIECNNIINEIFTEKNINVNLESLEKIINETLNEGIGCIKICKKINNKFNLFGYTIIVGVISSIFIALTTNENFIMRVCEKIFPLLVAFIMFYYIILIVVKFLYRKYYLYIQVLKEKKLTLAIKNEKD